MIRRLVCLVKGHVPSERRVLLGWMETGLGNVCLRCDKVLTYITRENPGQDGFPYFYGEDVQV